MKNYKIWLGEGNSNLNKLILEKAESLGYKSGYDRSLFIDKATLYFDSRAISHQWNDKDYFLNNGYEEISIPDFLELDFSVAMLKVDSLEYEIVKLDDGSIKVGCQTISEEDFDKIVEFVYDSPIIEVDNDDDE